MKRFIAFALLNSLSNISFAQTPLTSDNFNNYAPSLTGAGASGSWNINVSNSARLGTLSADFSQYGGNLDWLAGLNATNSHIMPYKAADVKNFLGIPANGETLQSVTDRGWVTTNPITTSAEFRGQYNGIDFRAGAQTFAPAIAALGTNSAHPLGIFINGSEKMRMLENGNVGIGTTAPAYKLDVNGSAGFSKSINIGQREAYSPGTITRLSIQPYYHTGGPWLLNSRDDVSNAYLDINYNSERLFTIVHDGNVAIGTANPGAYKLAVEGTIGARKMKVTQEAWADYVFDSSYQLPSLTHVETFIKENKHLPEVPSAAEVKKDGLDLGDNQAILLKKIEELTLYIIQQNKELVDVKKRLSEIETRH